VNVPPDRNIRRISGHRIAAHAHARLASSAGGRVHIVLCARTIGLYLFMSFKMNILLKNDVFTDVSITANVGGAAIVAIRCSE
jgi:hypothetical protein